MSTALELNSQMPYMRFNWSEHASRVDNLTLSERGMFDWIRATLWKVVSCKMPRPVLEARLRIKPGSEEAAHLQTLLDLGHLAQDADGCIFDEVQAREFAEAVRKAQVNRANGAKGGRPPTARTTQAPTEKQGQQPAPPLADF
ncbi:hypothetical protein EYS42_08740 [Aquabacterium lacunae]|uniref:DUF1376 domain-containing protein n=1 Tax=Aquabacterium lacunae TaxID=2528630 RepID=A0A4Q9H4C0_9BURK|nr:hypothetical protein [Aquabacterium lacunae]TBO31322.1 hypothetical protein EYS42_08740 [Aquabacterium lacunae]